MARRILSVGYDRASLTLRNWVLERAGYEVLPAYSKRKALQLLRSESCELVLIAGSIAADDVQKIVQEVPGHIPVLRLFGGTREELPGIAAYMPLLDGPEALLNSVQQLLEDSKPILAAQWNPLLAKQQQRSRRRA